MHPTAKRQKQPSQLLQTSTQKTHKVENMLGRLKDWRRIAPRYERCADIFMAAITLAAAVIWWIK